MASRASLSRATEAFLRQMAADGRTPMSIHSYQRQLASFAQAVGDVPLRRLTPDHLNGYLTSPTVRLQVDGTPKATSTINRGKSVIRAFFRWCELTGLIERNPAAHVRLARPPASVTRHMTRGEAGRFLRTIRRARNPLSARDHALFATLVWTGIRRARIQKALSVHSLRHTFGTLLYQATRDLVLVSRALGHRDVKSTQRYVHLDDRVIAQAVSRMR
jgi:site-specific recombinase XerD